MYKIKNQNYIEDGHPADCSIYTLSTICEKNFWLNLSYWLIEKIAHIAVIDKVLLSMWAYFDIIYSWFEKKVDDQLKINVKIIKENITSNRFQELVEKWFYFWIWLKYWNQAYLDAVDRWILNKWDIDQIIKQKGWFWHNNCFWLSNWYHYWTSIYEIYKWKEVQCNIEVLRYWVERWVFYLPARTIWAEDYFTWEVIKILLQARDNPHHNNLWQDPNREEIEQKAFEILKKYKWNK